MSPRPARFVAAIHSLTLFFIIFVLGLPVAGVSRRPFGPSDPAVLTGTVVDRRGNPLADVKVTLIVEDPAGVRATDSKGRFRFDNVPPGFLTVLCERPGFRAASRELASVERNTEITITLLATGEAIVADRVLVVGRSGAASQIPGSAHYIDRLEESDVPFNDVHQVLRQVPGVNIQEEEGFGLRPNIGMRGTGSERSSKITLMEDGVLIAPAPYAAPSAYYFPSLGRMQALEVRKGSSQIRFGPRTNGGVLNLISSDIPGRLSLQGAVAGGAHSTGRLDLTAGDSSDRLGWMVETFQIRSDGFKRLESGGNTGFRISDYLGKLRIGSDSAASVYQQLELKVGKTTQRSDETYLGLTDPDFEIDSRQRYSGSQVDRFDSDHEQYQLSYLLAPSERFDITTSVYRNNFHRNWYKLQSVLGTGISDVFDDPGGHRLELDILKGADSAVDALTVRANNRDYYSQGVQSFAGFQLGRVHRLEAGFRYHEDREDRFQHEDGFQMLGGTMQLTSQGAGGSQSNRIGEARALSFFASDTITLGPWSITPGVRYERIRLTQTDYALDDPNRTAPTRIRENTLDVVVPGVGTRYDLDPTLSFFGGVHRGFAPPGPGSSDETRPEFSVNFEGGARWSPNGFQLEALAFVNNYSNLLGADTLSSGGTGEGDLFNGGRARSWGAELSGGGDASDGRLGRFQIPVRVSYTFTRSCFLESFESDFDPWGDVEAGDRIPYIAPHQLFASATFEAGIWRSRVEAIWVDRMRTEAGQGPLDPFRATDSQFTVSLSGEYDLPLEDQRATFFVTVQNLADARYVVARRPAGVRPGLTRTLMIGLRFNLGR